MVAAPQFYCRESSPFECEGVMQLACDEDVASWQDSLASSRSEQEDKIFVVDRMPCKRARPTPSTMGHSTS